MARNWRGKHKHQTKKERNVWNTNQDVTDDRDCSERLSSLLDHVAFNEHLMKFRRKRMLFCEHELTVALKAFGSNRRVYIFGSQVEGTTTIEMMSDWDSLHHLNKFHLFLDSENPPLLPHNNQVVLKVSTHGCASQNCILTLIEPSTQARLFQTMDPSCDPLDIAIFFQRDWRTTNGLVPHAVMFDKTVPQLHKITERHGPAETIVKSDLVHAFYCESLPNQCKFFFVKPRPGHWPSEKTLEQAKQYGVFIIPQGPPKNTNKCTYDYFECTYNYFDFQWRISTNFTERLLMFSLDAVHLKAFFTTKMIRKKLFAPEFQDRLSTFHFKTAFFFAIENTRPDVWREDNLIICVKYILETLRRFSTRRNCPHFTVENVNLFDGKIERHEFPKLVDRLTCVIDSLRTEIQKIQRDTILQQVYMRSTSTRSTECSYISPLLYHVFITCQGKSFSYSALELSKTPFNYRRALIGRALYCVHTNYHTMLGKYRNYEYHVLNVMSALANTLAAVYLEEKIEARKYNHDAISTVRQMYTQSLEFDSICNYVRYASFLFCNGEYNEACKYFDLIENLIQEDTKSNLVYQLLVSPSESLALQIAEQSYEHTNKQISSVFLIFSQEEAMCVPAFLRCEMYRGYFGYSIIDYQLLLVNEFSYHDNYDYICVHIEPYLYYLQYLTYRELQQESKQSESLMKLSKCTEIIKCTKIFSSYDIVVLSFSHFDTSLNMLGHCLELEQKWELAWKTYTTSLQLQPKRNAAALHITRLLWQVIQSMRT